jgi:hypothetical protein
VGQASDALGKTRASIFSGSTNQSAELDNGVRLKQHFSINSDFRPVTILTLCMFDLVPKWDDLGILSRESAHKWLCRYDVGERNQHFIRNPKRAVTKSGATSALSARSQTTKTVKIRDGE